MVICYGIGAIFGSYVSGRVNDRFGSVIGGRVLVSVFLSGCLCCVVAYEVQIYGFALLAAFNWGFYCDWQASWMYFVVAKYFKGLP